MKKLISLIIFLVFICTNGVFAIEDRKVVSDSDKQEELLKSFNEVNHSSSGGIFSQKNTQQRLYEKEKQSYENREVLSEGYHKVYRPKTLTPVKRIRLYLKERASGNKKDLKEEKIQEAEANILPEEEQIILDCDNMEYFAERTELEASGNVSMRFPQNNIVMTADKIVYNQTTNKITAVGHVIITKEDNKMEGDYLVVNMNEENAIFDNPETEIGQIHVRSKVGYLYGDDVIQEQGKIFVTKHTELKMRNETYGPNLDDMNVDPKDKSTFFGEGIGQKMRIKTSDIILNSKKEHETVTVKKAEIFFHDKKVGVIPAMTIHTNKNKDYVLIDNPEFGTMTDLGMYVGPGFVFDTPHGSALKLIPVFNYQSGGDRGSIGFGGIAKYRAATNRTDIAYGTANNVLLVDGLQYLDDNLFLQYGANRYIDDWFMGPRKARIMGELVYQDSVLHRNFLAKKLDMTFSHRAAVGYMQSGPNDTDIGLFGEEGIGTMRAKYMSEIRQTLFKINDETKDTVNARLELVGQGSFAVYGTGDTQAIVRIGPNIHHQYKRWMSDIAYLVSGFSDGTPMKDYDAYVYGKSNLMLRESLRLSKYLTLSWMSSFNLSYNDEQFRNRKMKLLPENTLFLAIGPDDLRLHVGYDFARQQSYIYMTMALDAKGAVIDYDKMIVKNPDNMNKKPKEILFVQDIPESKYEQYKEFPDEKNTTVIKEPEKAEVTDIINDERL